MKNEQLIRAIEAHLRDTPQDNASCDEIAQCLGLSEIDANGLDVLLDASPEVETALRYERGETHDGHPWQGFVLVR